MGDIGINLEALNSALKSIKILRSSVVEVFKFLDDGAAAAHDDGEREKFVNEAQQKLTSVRSRMRDLETACTLLGSPNVPLNLGNSGLLSQDPAYEKTSLYNDVVKSYQWFDKLHEHSSHACAILTQNSLKRTNNRPLSPNSMQTSRPQPTGHNVPAQTVDAVISQFNHVFPDMPIQIVRPCGASTVLLITLGRTLKALVILRGLIIEWVVVKGYDEDFNDRHEEVGITRNFTFPHDNQEEQFGPFEARQFVSVNTGRKLDMWSQSRYKVFQKVTDHANAAMLHFYSPQLPDLAVRSFLTWLRSYSNLFTATCRKCNVRLLDNMPPTWRDVRNLDVYHEACKP